MTWAKLSNHLNQWAVVYWLVSNLGLAFIVPLAWQGFAAIANALFILALMAILDKVTKNSNK